MAGKDTRRGLRRAASERQPSAEVARRLPEPSDPLFLRLARLLDPTELETEILLELSQRIGGATALISLDPLAAEPSRLADETGVRRWRERDGAPRVLAVPLSDRGEAVGWIGYLDDSRLRPRKAAATAHLLEVAAAAAIPAHNARRHAAALELTMRDPLTGLYNRRAFDAFLQREEQHAIRTGKPLALIAIDLDFFKQLNDSFGHQAGDAALRHFSRILTEAVRRSDIVARPGGDEFTVLLPETPASGAARIASRLRKMLAAEPLCVAPGHDPIVIGVSCGIADLQQAAGDRDTLQRLADGALYDAKRSGRNQVLRTASRVDDSDRMIG